MRRTRLVALSLALIGCRPADPPVFKLLKPEQTGVTFANTITTSDKVNVQTDVYVYNGAGVAVGDIDNDGLPDLFFAGNMVTSRLYLNKGQMRFEDITDHADTRTTRWATGATMVDINNDGFLDIYVSVSGPEWSKAADRANLLFINNGNRTFTESAAQYGIADTSFTTHSAFLDYDGDGCLDLFLLNNSPTDFSRGGVAAHPSSQHSETPGSYNELYHNDCHGHFTNVSDAAGILHSPGYGLGVAIADVNGDGWPDIYVSNDGAPNDVLYVNNGNGTFTNKAGRWLKHTSTAGMGVDIADFNNDGWPDILQVDMLPRDLVGRKRMSGFNTIGSVQEWRSRGFRTDFEMNSLQLNGGAMPNGDVVFSDVSRLAGLSATDWSWSALFADFDNDGYKDIFIGNGYPKAVNDLDYQNAAFGALRRGDTVRARRLLKDVYAYDRPNFVFRNNGDLTFADKSERWGMNQPSFSYGAAYADLDGDGRLDLVVNNMDAPAFIYENVQPSDDAHHWLAVRLEGDSTNRRGVGATVSVVAGGKRQHVYYSPVRGYMSSMDGPVHFGLGKAKRVDSLEVVWPDGRSQLLTNLSADTLFVVKSSAATRMRPRGTPQPARERPFEQMDPRQTLAYSHQVTTQVDYSVQPLLPYQLSRHGPVLATADVNGDGFDDVYIGGGAGVPGQLFLQRADGSFVASVQGQPWEADKAYDDWGALFFDANGDGLPDLYVASGGYQLAPTSPLLQDRLYINQGHGSFVKADGALPPMLTSTAVVRAADFTGDGKLDLFVGGRLTPRTWPFPARSYLLRNDGAGHFTDVTADVAPELAKPNGMVTDAAWIDFDGDGKRDLVTVGEWMPIQFYKSDGKRLHNVTASMHLPPMRGWWYSLAAGDFDGDGRIDLVAGNLGLNYSYTTSDRNRFGVYAAAFSGGQDTDILLTQEIDGTDFPYSSLATIGRDMYSLGIRFPTFGSFARATVAQAFTPAQLQRAVHYQTDTFASVYLHNDGGGAFTSTPLPNLAQIAPVRAIVAHDVDGDGHLDLLLAGNLYDAEPNTPRADAGNGLWLRGDGRGHFTPVLPSESGFLAPLNVSAMALIGTRGGKAVLVANTGDSLQVFRLSKRARELLSAH